MAFSVNNPDFSIPNTPASALANQLDREEGTHVTSMDSVCMAKVSQSFLNSSPKEVTSAFSQEETLSRKRKERECSSELSLEGHPTRRIVGLVNRSLFLEPYVPFYTLDPLTKSPKPPISLAPFMPKDCKYLDFFPRSLQSPLPNQEALQPVSASSSSSSTPIAQASIAESSSVPNTEAPYSSQRVRAPHRRLAAIEDSKPSEKEKDGIIKSLSSSRMAEAYIAESSSVLNTEALYSFRRVRTPNCRLAPIEDSKPSEKEKDGIIKSFEEQGIEYVADVQIDPKNQPIISDIFNSIPDDKLSDDINPEGKACSLCIKTMSDDASDKYASAVEVKEVIFTRQDGSEGREKGVFAKRQIKKGSAIGIYAGDLVPLDSCKDGDKDYVFEFSEPAFDKWGIDAKKRGNFTRYINHCEQENENVTGVGFYDGKIPRIIFISTRQVKKGTQLMYDYGDDYWERKGFKPSNF